MYQPSAQVCFPGPLMSKEMKKEDLLRFIHWKAQECLQQVHTKDQAETYIFWQIMELFCHKDGKVEMYEVAPLIFQVYSMLRKTASRNRYLKDMKLWCFPLAKLLSMSTPDDEQRVALIKMGDDLAHKKMTYGAHICYAVAQVELGSRCGFELIGCHRVPFGVTVLEEAIQRTETYEYVLSLTSGLSQPSLLIFKLCHASRLSLTELTQAECTDSVRKYCASMVRTAIEFPDRISRTLVERLILLSYNVEDESEEPEWLLELQQLQRTKLANATANGDSEQQMEFKSNYEILDSEGCPKNDEIHVPVSCDLEKHLEADGVFESRYTVGDLLGEGGFSVVYEGVRKEDGKEVAIKFVSKELLNDTMTIPGETEELPKEVALMKMVCKPPRCSNVLELLDWFDRPKDYLLILERPSPCMDIFGFSDVLGGRLSEAQTRDIMLQVIRAARHCCDRGVLHRDIKAENLLINTDTMEVKLIDFGCGVLLRDAPYEEIAGTDFFMPPEVLIYDGYMGVSATIWGLGVLIFYVISGHYPLESMDQLKNVCLEFCPDMSRECFELIMWCLELDPNLRPTLDDLVRHEWFTKALQ